MTGKCFYPVLFLAMLFIAVDADAVSISASVDTEEVEVGDPINLSLTISGKGMSLPDPVLPDLSDFDVYSSGRNSNFSMINGAFSSSLELSYTLIPKKVGMLTIGPITVREKGSSASTDPIKIHVKEQGAISTQPRGQTGRPQAESRQKQKDFFIEQVVNKVRPYVNEQVTLTLRFYQAVTLWDQPTLEWPKYTGVTIEDLPPNTRTRKYVNGRLYQVTEIKRALFPLTSGDIMLDSPRLTIRADNLGGTMDPFSLFDRDFFNRGRPVVLTANRIKLNVRPIPSKGKPANYAGAVGKYSIKAVVDKDSVGVDEPITLRVILSGTGNLKSLPSVTLPEFSDFRVYESGKNESINQQGGKISGSRTFEMALIPKTSGNFEIPALEYSFFDPSDGKYETVKTKPINIIATGEGLADVGGAPKNIIEASRRSFGYIVTEFPEQETSFDLSKSVWFWILQGFPVFGIMAALIFRNHYRKLLGDRSYARRISAGRRSRSVFKSAYAKMTNGNFGDVYSDLYDAVIGFVADRLDLHKSGLILDDLRGIGKIGDGVKEELIDFLENCQNARFAPMDVDRNRAEEMIKRGEMIVSKLEKFL